MTTLPGVLAYFDERLVARDDLGRCLAAAAAVGPALALVVRCPGAPADRLLSLAERAVANATPPQAEVWVSGRVDIAIAAAATGVVRQEEDLGFEAMRAAERAAAQKSVRRHVAQVHSVSEAASAVACGADALVVGTIWRTASHPGRAGAGPELLAKCAELGVPIYAIGGITPERAVIAREHGAWGVAAIRAIWDAGDIYRAAGELAA